MKRTRTAKEEATDEFKEKVVGWALQLRVKPVRVRVQRMTRKWGSCSTGGWVTFARDLLGTSSAFQDYVIVHELLHLKVPNHGRLFKSYLTAYLPDWKQSAHLFPARNFEGRDGYRLKR
jgi:predicted metal-dependent hydrolase